MPASSDESDDELEGFDFALPPSKPDSKGSGSASKGSGSESKAKATAKPKAKGKDVNKTTQMTLTGQVAADSASDGWRTKASSKEEASSKRPAPAPAATGGKKGKKAGGSPAEASSAAASTTQCENGMLSALLNGAQQREIEDEETRVRVGDEVDKIMDTGLRINPLLTAMLGSAPV